MKLFTDGAARGNPGEAGGGIVLWDKKKMTEKFVYFGKRTNNEAEYIALIEGIKLALGKGAKTLAIHMDSELIVRQLKGEYKVKNERLILLHKQVMELLSGLKWAVVHIKREENRRADFLANLAIDEKAKASSSSPRKP